MSKRILVLDLDTPIFAASAVSETRTVLVTHKPTGKQKEFPTRTEFKDVLKSKDKLDKLDEYEYLDVQTPEPAAHACHVLKSQVAKIQELVQADETLFFVSGKNNFRDNLELPSRYKSSRQNTLRPLLLKDVKQFAINKFKATICDGEEPDDAIIYKTYELKQQGCTPIISSIDKDCLAYSGLSVFNQDKPEQGVVEIPELGSLWIDSKNKVRGNGFLWYCFQHGNGDRIDGFNPAELCNAKFGEKSAYKLLVDCKSEKVALDTLLIQYKKWYPKPITYTAWNEQQYTKDYVQIADLYFKCCRMKSHEFDDLDFVKFCQQYGVQP